MEEELVESPSMEHRPDDFFEIILTRTDDHEFVAVARFASSEGISSTVESGDRIADLWRRLVVDEPERHPETLL